MHPDGTDPPRALLVSGTVGAGKTSVAEAAGSLLAQAGVPGATIDLDAIRCSWPTRTDDPFNLTMALRNVESLARNYLSDGARRLVLSGVVETREQRARYHAALGIDLCVCRLRADLVELQRRLRVRHAGAADDLQWHLHRAPELDEILDRSGVEDFEVSSDGHEAAAGAATVLTRAGWL